MYIVLSYSFTKHTMYIVLLFLSQTYNVYCPPLFFSQTYNVLLGYCTQLPQCKMNRVNRGKHALGVIIETTHEHFKVIIF